VVVSGPSGAGKTTLLKQVCARCPLPLRLSVSATTRAPRPGERDGVDYYYLSAEEFARRRAAGEFLESCEVFGRGHWYGTLASEVLPRLAEGWWVILEIDVQGAMAILDRFPQAVTFFVRPASWEALEARLRGRATETDQQVEARLAVARRELAAAGRYRHQVVNVTVDAAVEEICRLLQQAESEP
jgi:guanylate kinase